MAERYYWPNDPTQQRLVKPGDRAELSGDEAHHLTRVMRQKTGDTLVLFDGNGCEFSAEIIETRKSLVTLTILDVRQVDTESLRRVTIATSLPKGDRQKWLVEKLTELGCHRLIPLQTERTVAQCSEQVIERLQRQVLEATKQCNRSHLMAISPEKDIAECMNDDDHMVGLIAHPLSDGDFGQLSLSELAQMVLPKCVSILIGPEGGFTTGEVERAIELGFRPIDLGPRILRVETAAVMMTSIIASLP